MNKFHELLEYLNNYPGAQQDYSECAAAARFDLGSAVFVQDMARISKCEFFEIPANPSLFQVGNRGNASFYLARTIRGMTVWSFFGEANGRWFTIDADLYLTKTGRDWFLCNRFTGEILNLRRDEFGNEAPQFIHELTGNLREVMLLYLFVVTAVEVFSCANVTTHINYPSRHANKQRERKSQRPFLAYKTLHITGAGSANGVRLGTHASPRVHLRRGHIRRISHNRRIWVQPCLVGDKNKGMSKKDYIVDRQVLEERP